MGGRTVGSRESERLECEGDVWGGAQQVRWGRNPLHEKRGQKIGSTAKEGARWREKKGLTFTRKKRGGCKEKVRPNPGRFERDDPSKSASLP